MKEEIPRQQLQQVQQMHRGDLLPERASSYKRGAARQMEREVVGGSRRREERQSGEHEGL